ncbi:MAG TPA: hypothetical protein VGA02_15120 [Gemmatimonadales bacterium]|jgi:hypothetical protein
MRRRWLVPPTPFRGILLQRAAVLWLLGRLIVAFFVLIYEGAESPVTDAIRLGAPASLGLTAVVATLTLLDVFRRHETILLANLGVSRVGIAALAAASALALEALTWLVPV